MKRFSQVQPTLLKISQPYEHFTQEQKVLFLSLVITLLFFLIYQSQIFQTLFRKIPTRKRRSRQGLEIGKVWVDDSARLRHTHIVGATGTGKTVLIERLLFNDLKRGLGAIVIDPKGEQSFLESVRAYCKHIGREKDFKVLSANSPDQSSIWNPCGLGSASELQTKLFQSGVYNEPHYAKACEYGLLRAFKTLIRNRNHGFNVGDLVQELEIISEQEKDRTLQGLFFDLKNLISGEWETILACGPDRTKNKAREISLLDVVSRNQILFVDLPTEGKKVQSSRIGKILTQEIMLISGLRKRFASLKGTAPFSIYIDEFDAFASESFSTFLNKGRSSNFMIHLAHQTLSDLNIISPEFTGQILGNCNLRFIFRQDDPDDAERWSRFIGTKKVVKQTYRTTEGSRTGDSSNREALEFLIPPDEIKTLKTGECVVSVKTAGINQRIKVPFTPTNFQFEKLPEVSVETRSSGDPDFRPLQSEELASLVHFPAQLDLEIGSPVPLSANGPVSADKWDQLAPKTLTN